MSEGQLPYSIRAMLRIVTLASSFSSQYALMQAYEQVKNMPVLRVTNEAIQLPILASLLVGSWLNVGLRDPSIFGVPAPLPDYTNLHLAFFQSSRILFENMMA